MRDEQVRRHDGAAAATAARLRPGGRGFAKFDVLRRAWCVAELVQAYRSGLAQRVKIHSVECLDDHIDQVAKLRVEDCQASRPDDKAAILSRIPDLEAFNKELQELVCGSNGLFDRWNDGVGRMENAGQMARRALRRVELKRADPPHPPRTPMKQQPAGFDFFFRMVSRPHPL